MSRDPKSLIIALDFADEKAALHCAAQLDPHLCRLKIGKALFTRSGPQFVKKIIAQGFEVFLDLKYHDIPHTVGQACQAAADLGVWMLNVHAAGGSKMLEAAKTALLSFDKPPLLIAVTVLTSMDAAQLAELGLPAPDIWVRKLAQLTKACDLDGVVCSAQEASMLKALYGQDFTLVTPGIRLSSSSRDDQERVMSPQAAIQAGADYLVIGRPVTQSKDPRQVLIDIDVSIQNRTT